MNSVLIVYCVLTALTTVGLIGWVFEMVGWEDKKTALWREDKPAERSLLHRFGFLLAFPMILTAAEANRISGYSWLGWALTLGTIVICVAGLISLVAIPVIWEVITDREAFMRKLSRKRRKYR